jgi:hypothetical protein
MLELLVGLLFLAVGLCCFVLAAGLTAPARRKARVRKRVLRLISAQDRSQEHDSSVIPL